jgi:hypothetical protein
MSTKRNLRVGLTIAAALVMLSACASPDDVADLDDRVEALEGRLDTSEARASQLEAAANQCTSTCQDVEARADRMLQQSLHK